MAQELYKLPQGWEWTPLGKVVTLINGRAYKKNELLDEGPMPVLRVGNLFTNRHWFYSDLELPEDKYCDEGDLIYAWSASFGPRIWEGPKVIYHYHIWKVLTSEQIDKKYLFYLLKKDSEKIKSQGNGVGMFHATKGGMEKMPIPLPDLSIQQALVKKLDALLSRIDIAIEHLEHNLELNDQLFVSSLNQAFNPLDAEIQSDGTYQLPKGWEWLEFKKLFSTKGYTVGKIKSSEYQDKGAYPVIDQSQKYIAGYFDEQSLAYQGELPVIVYGDHTNAVKYVDFEFISGADGTKVLTISKQLSPKYAYYLIESFKPETQGYRRHYSILNKLKIPVSNFETQELIAKKLIALESKTQANKKVLQQKLEQLQQLKASLLDSAFRGDL